MESGLADTRRSTGSELRHGSQRGVARLPSVGGAPLLASRVFFVLGFQGTTGQPRRLTGPAREWCGAARGDVLRSPLPPSLSFSPQLLPDLQTQCPTVYLASLPACPTAILNPMCPQQKASTVTRLSLHVRNGTTTAFRP